MGKIFPLAAPEQVRRLPCSEQSVDVIVIKKTTSRIPIGSTDSAFGVSRDSSGLLKSVSVHWVGFLTNQYAMTLSNVLGRSQGGFKVSASHHYLYDVVVKYCNKENTQYFKINNFITYLEIYMGPGWPDG